MQRYTIISLIITSSLWGALPRTSILPVYSVREQAIFKSILSTAPERVNTLHRRFKDTGRDYRAALFYGDAGTGKSDCALAIVNEAQYTPYVICPHDISVGRYSETANKLTEMLNEVTSMGTEVGVIIEEADKIFDHPKQENRDTLQTASALWTWMDRLKRLGRSDIWLFLTANDGTVFPQPLMSRLSGYIFEFKNNLTPAQKAEGYCTYVTISEGHEEKYKEEITQLFKKYPEFTGRDFSTINQLSQAMVKDARAAAPDGKRILCNPSYIERAMKNIHAERIATKYYNEEESTQDQSERHYKTQRNLGFAGAAMQGVGLVGQVATAILKK